MFYLVNHFQEVLSSLLESDICLCFDVLCFLRFMSQ